MYFVRLVLTLTILTTARSCSSSCRMAGFRSTNGASAADLLREHLVLPNSNLIVPRLEWIYKRPSLGGSDTFEFGINKGTFDLAKAGVGSISDLMKTFLGFKTLALGKDQLQTNKDQFNQNFAQQTAAANDRRLQYNQTNDAKRRFIQGNSANKDTSFLRDLVPA
jgi:hypothetical protein